WGARGLGESVCVGDPVVAWLNRNTEGLVFLVRYKSQCGPSGLIDGFDGAVPPANERRRMTCVDHFHDPGTAIENRGEQRHKSTRFSGAHFRIEPRECFRRVSAREMVL